jgi:hypothetical protein
VGNSELSTDAVTRSKIAASAVGNFELSTNAVTRLKIASGAVGQSEISNDAVGAGELRANSVNESELGTNTVRGRETLQIVRGTVSLDGSVLHGQGFTSTKESTGRYSISFSPNFSGTPSATANQLGTDDDNVILFETIDKGGFKVNIVDTSSDGASREDDSFMFIVVGPVVP